MKLIKGTINYYFATGETPHFYVYDAPLIDGKYEDWEHHHGVYAEDVLLLINPNGEEELLFKDFPTNMEDLKANKQAYDTIVRAVNEVWQAELVQINED